MVVCGGYAEEFADDVEIGLLRNLVLLFRNNAQQLLLHICLEPGVVRLVLNGADCGHQAEEQLIAFLLDCMKLLDAFLEAESYREHSSNAAAIFLRVSADSRAVSHLVKQIDDELLEVVDLVWVRVALAALRAEDGHELIARLLQANAGTPEQILLMKNAFRGLIPAQQFFQVLIAQSGQLGPLALMLLLHPQQLNDEEFWWAGCWNSCCFSLPGLLRA